jgi:hypothetical protein
MMLWSEAVAQLLFPAHSELVINGNALAPFLQTFL